MKKVTLLIMAFALVFGLSQCKKTSVPTLDATQHVVLKTSLDDGSKVEQIVNELKWSKGDVINVCDGNGDFLGHLDYVSENSFEGDIQKTTCEKVYFRYGKDIVSPQTGDLNDAIYLSSDNTDYNPEGVYSNVDMNLLHAVLKLDLSALGTTAGNEVVISYIPTGWEEPIELTRVGGVKSSKKIYYVAMPAENLQKTYLFVGNGKNVQKEWKLSPNKFYTKNAAGDAIVIEP